MQKGFGRQGTEQQQENPEFSKFLGVCWWRSQQKSPG
jgi:hypothetical protein